MSGSAQPGEVLDITFEVCGKTARLAFRADESSWTLDGREGVQLADYEAAGKAVLEVLAGNGRVLTERGQDESAREHGKG